MYVCAIWTAALVLGLVLGHAPAARADEAAAEALQAHGWARRAVSEADARVRVFLGVPLNTTRIEQEIAAVSDPCSDRYAQYLDANATLQLLAPAARHTHVERWLAERAVPYEAAHGLYALDLDAARASELFGTTYHTYEHRDGRRAVHALAHDVPAELRGHAEVFGPGIGARRRGAPAAAPASAPRAVARRNEAAATAYDCEMPVYPSCMRRVYATGNYTVQVPAANRLGVAGFAHEVPDAADLRAYLQHYRPDAANATFATAFASQHANDTYRDLASAGRMEANLDVQMAVSQAFPIPVTYYYTSGHAPHRAAWDESGKGNEPFLRLFAYLLTLPDAELPRVLSLSYADVEATVPKAYARRVCMYAALLGLRGVTIVAGSGDEGVGPASAAHCPTGGGATTQFVPWFPSTCPYVTSVGGTATPPTETVADRVRDGFSTGSGFSNYFAQPAWQQSVVQRYVNDSVAPAFRTHFWADGRAYPDVAVVATSLATWMHNATVQTSGTSASAPIFAATVALLNDVRLAANQTYLGFLNPLLYTRLAQEPGAFYDVQHGSNSGCGTAGFNATPGWDAASGFGSPRFGALQRAVLAGCAA
ncbi:hypothetical protein MBRA1_003691 [Malassezia brasiliensis]|uniref:tripeptidyl-peptidase II n=1 Tax=Malassezia brasiliensis TaxID=1821822 RepID=A0AAF0DX55_9BASI|nr:hypothetical protein MBRA1_003691 [Malassezia brasiliensis]